MSTRGRWVVKIPKRMVNIVKELPQIASGVNMAKMS